MIYYILGIITGLLIDIYRPTLARTVRQLESKVKKKGSISIPSDEKEQLSNWINELPTE